VRDRDRDRSLLLLLTGLFAVWLAASGTVLNFVRPSIRPYVLLAGLVAVLLAVLPPGGLLGRRTAAVAHDHEHPDAGVGWLLVVPLFVALLVPPAPLGANAVRSRLSTTRSSASSVYPAVRAPDHGAVPMTMAEFSTRALRDRQRSLTGVPVRLTGFVSDGSGTAYSLGRFVIFCCAADAEAVEVRIVGDTTPRRTNEWLEVVGVWVPQPLDADVVSLRVTSVRPVKRPRAPYEYTAVWTG
jgi:uncharacterized repeat protein (TIGR03943 family)